VPSSRGHRASALDASGLYVDDGLVVGQQLPGRQRRTQLGLDLHPIARSVVLVRAEEGVGRAGHLLRPAHRLRTGADQRRTLYGMLGIKGDPNADAHIDRLFLHMDRLVQGVHHALGGLKRGLGAVDILQHDGELVVADASDRVAFPRALPEATRDFLQQKVSDFRTDFAVHRIEAVEIQIQQGDAAIRPPGAGQGQLQPVVEQQAVGQPR